MTRFLPRITTVLCLLLAFGGGLVARAQDRAAPARQGFVALIELDGAIGPASAEYFVNAAKRAEGDGARAIVLRLDTPGGLSESMRQIIGAMLAAKIPVLGYVAPGGARAASAGTYILYASQIAAMAPATHLGAATPVSLGGDTPMPSPRAGSAKAPDTKPTAATSTGNTPHADKADDVADDNTSADAESHKILNDSIAYIRSLAQLRDRNADWAEKAVRGAATLTASEALQKHVIDLIANDVPALLSQADGRHVSVDGQMRALQLKNLEVRAYEPNWRSRFLGVITNPTIAYLLLLAGIFGLVLEAFHPGALFPGVAGGICLLIGLYALQMLPVNYAGLALMALGIGLLIAEVMTPTVGALGIGGVIAFVVGSIMLMNTGVPGYAVNLGVIGGIAFVAFALLALILWAVMRSRDAHKVSGDQTLLDAVGELLQPVEAGGTSWIHIHGERWKVRCDTTLPAGAPVRVLRRSGLLLWVAPV